MTTPEPKTCPFHSLPANANPIETAGNVANTNRWPPGPKSGLTGWGLLRQMSRDLLGSVTQWQQAYGDVIHLRIWPEHQIIITNPELARELLVTHHDALIRWERGVSVFATLQANSVLVAEGSAWRSKRHSLTPGFSPKSVSAFTPAIADATDKAFKNWPASSADWPIEQALTSLTMDVIMRMLFSSDMRDDARRAEQAAHTALVEANDAFYWPASWPDWLPWKRKQRRARKTLVSIVDHHIQARLALPSDSWPDDLLTRLLQLHQQDPQTWPLQTVADECMTIFMAGHETAAATLTWWAWCMASNPTAQAQARAEVQNVLADESPTAAHLPSLTYLVQTLKETLRLYPAAPVLLSRRCTRALSLGPWHFSARTMFMIPLVQMHHDARWFPEPLQFQPERFAAVAPDIPRGAYFPFGAGPRVCLGQHLAMTEMTVIAAMLLQRFELKVPIGMATPQAVLHVSLRPKVPLHLHLHSHS